MIHGIFFCVALWAAYMIGWVHAHKTVASECERLGSFYVGKVVYSCTAIKAKE